MEKHSLLSKAGFKKTAITSCCIACLLLSMTIEAQVHTSTSKFGVTTTTTTTTVNPMILKAAMAPHAMRYKDFKKSDLYGKRLRLYSATFHNPSKSFTMADGTSMSINFIKKPSFSNNTATVTPSFTSGPVHNASSIGPAYYAIESDQGWVSNSCNARIRSTSVDFAVTDGDSQVNHIYPGAIYTFDSYMNGSYQTPSASSRNTITLATDNSNAQNNFVQVAHPDASNVESAVANMVNHFSGTGGVTTTYRFFESNNMADWTIKANAGGSNNSSNLLNNSFFKTSDRRHHRYITIDVTKRLFTIFTNLPNNGFYSVTNSTEATPNLMVVGSVDYGVHVLVTMELTFPNQAASDEFKNKLGLLQYSGSFDMNYLQSHASEITRIAGYEIGGTHNGNVSINKYGIQSNINNILSGATVHNAKPVSYRLYDMAYDIIGANASTGLFKYVNATPHPVLMSASVSINCGGDGKNTETHYYYSLFQTNGSAVASYANTGGHSEWQKNTKYHVNSLSVGQNQGISEFVNGVCDIRMIIAKPGTEPHNNPHFYTDPISNALTGICRALLQTVTSLSKDDIHPFDLTLTLGFSKPGQSGIQYHNITWNNLSISTKDNPMLNLHFKYSNGTFIKQ